MPTGTTNSTGPGYLTLRQLAEHILALPPDEQKEPAFINSLLFMGHVSSVGHLGRITELKNAAGHVFGTLAAKTPVLHVPTTTHADPAAFEIHTLVLDASQQPAWNLAVSRWNEEHPNDVPLAITYNERDHFVYGYLTGAQHLHREQLLALGQMAGRFMPHLPGAR